MLFLFVDLLLSLLQQPQGICIAAQDNTPDCRSQGPVSPRVTQPLFDCLEVHTGTSGRFRRALQLALVNYNHPDSPSSGLRDSSPLPAEASLGVSSTTRLAFLIAGSQQDFRDPAQPTAVNVSGAGAVNPGHHISVQPFLSAIRAAWS